MPAPYSADYYAGGISYEDNGAEVGTFGGAIGRLLNNLSGKTAQNIYASSEAQKNRDFQEYMSSSAYQRAVKDMKAAGVNPATLTGLNGSSGAASTPSGGQASSSSDGGALTAVIGALVKIAIASAA